jgi:hypothetical protein
MEPITLTDTSPEEKKTVTSLPTLRSLNYTRDLLIIDEFYIAPKRLSIAAGLSNKALPATAPPSSFDTI